MKVAVTGASGLIGSALVQTLRDDGHDVLRFVRRTATAPDERPWDPDGRRLDPLHLAGLDAVVHLAGAGVAAQRWTSGYKEQVLRSREDGTAAVAEAVAAAGTPVLLSASGVNWYGDTGDRLTDETGRSGDGFLAEVCRRWEAATAPAEAAGARVVHLRTGVVLTRRGGALARQLPVFRAFLGAPLGDGRQWLSWISLDDELAALRHLLTAPVSGPVNVVSPSPVRNREFTRALGRAVHRPTIPVPVPRLVLRPMFGQVVDEVLLAGQRLRPGVLEASGFTWRHPDLEPALRAALSQGERDA